MNGGASEARIGSRETPPRVHGVVPVAEHANRRV